MNDTTTGVRTDRNDAKTPGNAKDTQNFKDTWRIIALCDFPDVSGGQSSTPYELLGMPPPSGLSVRRGLAFYHHATPSG